VTPPRALYKTWLRRIPWLEALRPLSAPSGVFGVRGNHDWYRGVERVTDVASAAGIRMPVNASVAVQRGGESLYLAGVDDLCGPHQDLGRALAGVPREAAVILLAHEPDFADTAALDDRIVLQLSGHSHGGQVRIPLLDATWLPRYGQKYPAGAFQIIGRSFDCGPQKRLASAQDAAPPKCRNAPVSGRVVSSRRLAVVY
jgi:predicted MPP superfamily phosphohydrolase